MALSAGARQRTIVGLWLAWVALFCEACVVVPRNRREHLADPTMQLDDDVLETRARGKLHASREGASGGDGQSGGGGCGCTN